MIAMRLIDADALEYHKQLECMGNGQYEDVKVVYEWEVNSAPTIDAVEVVRCKECKHRYGYECPMYYVEWFTIDWYDRDFRVIDDTQDEGFCHCGERSEE